MVYKYIYVGLKNSDYFFYLYIACNTYISKATAGFGFLYAV